MNISFPKIDKIVIVGLNFNERKKIESIIKDENSKNIFQLDKQFLKGKINSINIIGNTRTLDRVIRRELDLSEGDAYNKFILNYSK